MAAGDTNFTNMVLSGTLAVTGTTTLTGGVTLTGGLSIGTTLGVTGLSTLTGGVLVDGGNITATCVNINLDPTGTYDLAMDATMTHTTTLADNLASALVVKDGTVQYLDIDTVTGTEKIDLGNTTDNPAMNVLGSGQVTVSGNADFSAGVDISGGALTVDAQAITQTTSGQVTFAGNVDAANGVDVTTAALTTAAGLTVSGGAVGVICTNIDLDPTGTVDLAMDNGQAFSVDIDGAASNITLATDGAAQDLTLAVTGATDSSLVMASAGTGDDACSLAASAGGVEITAAASILLDSTNPMSFALGGNDALQLDDAAISAFAGETDEAGPDVYIETADAGATPTVARAGGAYSFKCGDGASAANAVACGAGGSMSFSSGRGGVNTGGAAGEVGGAGGSITWLCEEGGDTNSQGAHDAGAGQNYAISAGAGGNATAGTGNGGASGDIVLTVSDGGSTTGGAAGADGAIALAGQVQHYRAGDASGVLLHSIGPAVGEGMETYIVDRTISPAAIETAVFTVPAGAIIDLVQANCESALTGGSTTETWSVGINGDVDKYGSAGLYPTQGASLAQNGKSNWLATSVQLTSSEAIVLSGAIANGTAAGDTALTVGSVRVVIIYRTYNALANA